jgi:signal transduction histidine kinase
LEDGDTVDVVNAVFDRIRQRAYEALVLTFAVASVVEALAAPHVAHRPIVAVLALGWTVPFALRRRFPFWAPLVALAALATFALISPERSLTSLTMPFLAALAAAVSLGLIGDRRQSVAGWAAVITTASIVSSKSGNAYSDFFWTTLILTLAWFFGSALGSRTEQARELTERVEAAERERATAAERATTEERARIARELHDVIAHSVSVIVVQAGAAEPLVTENPDQARESLRSIRSTASDALGEMRRLLGILRTTGDELVLNPQPSVAQLEPLLAQARAAGLEVELHIEGKPRPLAPGLDLAAYRIVQEALTNTRKHACASRAAVALRYTPSALEVEVLDDGNAPATAAGNGGHGLVGMRERVALYDGTLDSGAREGGGYAVHAVLPT